MEIQINPVETHETGESIESAKKQLHDVFAIIGFQGENLWFLRPDLIENNFDKIEPAILLLKDLTSTWGAELFDDNVGMLDGFLLILRYGQVGNIQLAKDLLAQRKLRFPDEPLLPSLELVEQQNAATQPERIKALLSHVENQSLQAYEEWLAHEQESIKEILLTELLAEGGSASKRKGPTVGLVKAYDADLAYDCFTPYLISGDATKLNQLRTVVASIVETFLQQVEAEMPDPLNSEIVLATTQEGYQRFVDTGSYHGRIQTAEGNKLGGWNQRMRAEAQLGVDALGIEDDQLTAYGVMSVGADSYSEHQETGYGDTLIHLKNEQLTDHVIFTTNDSGAFFQRRGTEVQSQFGVEHKNIWQLNWKHAAQTRYIMDRVQAMFPSIKEVYGQDYVEAQILGGFTPDSVASVEVEGR
ncbi:hypothetical protein KC921_04965 [Candidatus Woesebacteria bacterium]|nr:hypothetical protein [Candidatus Woesebacteria bacterium]